MMPWRACKFASRVTFGGFSNFIWEDKISNHNGFGKVHLVLFNVQ